MKQSWFLLAKLGSGQLEKRKQYKWIPYIPIHALQIKKKNKQTKNPV